jgi:hypothetical protein
MNRAILSLACLVVFVARFTVPSHALSWPGTYEAIAHLLVGGLVGAWLASRDRKYLYMFLFLSCVEMAAFVLSR